MLTMDDIKNGPCVLFINFDNVVERVLDTPGKTPEEDVIVDRAVMQEATGEIISKDLHWFYRGDPNNIHSCSGPNYSGDTYPAKAYVPMASGF